MVILGLILLILGLLLSVNVLFWLGLVLVIVGLVLGFGPISSDGPRRRYW